MSWQAIDGRTYAPPYVPEGKIKYGPPRRFCTECHALTVCYLASHFDETPRCGDCSKRLKLPTLKDAFPLKIARNAAPPRSRHTRAPGAERFSHAKDHNYPRRPHRDQPRIH
jgi:hypothetical protein